MGVYHGHSPRDYETQTPVQYLSPRDQQLLTLDHKVEAVPNDQQVEQLRLSLEQALKTIDARLTVIFRATGGIDSNQRDVIVRLERSPSPHPVLIDEVTFQFGKTTLADISLSPEQLMQNVREAQQQAAAKFQE